MKVEVVEASIRLFDFPSIYAAHVAGRHLVYLDNGIWIDLADAKTEAARECLSTCRELRKSKRIIFPLSLAAVTELLDNPVPDNRRTQAALMDELSEGVCFRYPAAVAAEEAASASPFIIGEPPAPTPVERLFTYVAGYLGDSAIAFPEDWPPAARGQFARLVESSPELRSAVWLCEHLPVDKLRERHKDILRSHYVPRAAASATDLAERARSPSGKLDRNAIIANERAFLFREFVLPHARTALLTRYPPSQLLELIRARTAKEGEGNPARLGELFRHLPSLELFAEVMTARVLNPDRKPRPNDFMDHHHAHVAPVYCDAFATTDSGLEDLLSRRCQSPQARGCRILRGPAQLTPVLRTF